MTEVTDGNRCGIASRILGPEENPLRSRIGDDLIDRAHEVVGVVQDVFPCRLHLVFHHRIHVVDPELKHLGDAQVHIFAEGHIEGASCNTLIGYGGVIEFVAVEGDCKLRRPNLVVGELQRFRSPL